VANHPQSSARPTAARRRRLLLYGLVLLPLAALAAPPGARIVDVDHAFLPSRRTPMPGAGVRVFQAHRSAEEGRERFEIRWMAAPPGIPAGAVLLLETLHAHSSIRRNYTLRTPSRADGLVQSVIVISPGDISRYGRVRGWRLSVVWRGRVLARRASPNWTG